MTDVSASLERADRGGSLQPKELLRIAGILRCARTIKGYVAEDEEKTVLDPLFQGLTPNKYLEDKIFGAILSEEEIADNASPALAEIRRRVLLHTARAQSHWNKTLRKGVLRALSLLFRLSCVSVPMILAMEWIIRSGALDFWDQMMPQIVSQFIPEQLLTIMAAQIGGLIQSATVSAGLLAEHLITGPQVLLAMLISSAASNPIRTLRRNLPTALAIFPMRTALIIVLGMQLARFIIVVTAAILLMVWMQMNIA